MCVDYAAAHESDVWPPLRLAHVGGAPLPDEVRADLERTFACAVHEEALYRHPDVQEAAVAGLPDAALGGEVAAFVVLRPGRRPTPTPCGPSPRRIVHLGRFRRAPRERS